MADKQWSQWMNVSDWIVAGLSVQFDTDQLNLLVRFGLAQLQQRAERGAVRMRARLLYLPELPTWPERMTALLKMAETAAKLARSELTDEERNLVKGMNFARAYGTPAKGLARVMGVAQDKIAKLQEQFMVHFDKGSVK